jgi:pyridoxine kinase
MTVISIQSQVAFGHVGNSAAMFPLQMHGIDVIAVPTTLLSNRPGYPSIRGRMLEAPLVADLLRGIEERGAVESCEMILSGYLGSAENAAVVADFVARAKARNPALTYCCDPVLGDRDRGLFVHADIPPQVADPAVSARRYYHAQSFRIRMVVRHQGRNDRSGDRSGAHIDGARAVDSGRHQRRACGHA